MELKKSSDIRRIAKERLSNCWAESVGITLILAGIIIAFVISFLLVVRFLYTFGVLDFDIDSVITQGTPAFWMSFLTIGIPCLIISVPLSYGVNWFYMQAVMGRQAPASAFFSCYTNKEQFKRVLLLNMQVTARKAVMVIPLCLLGIVEIIAAEHLLKTKDSFIYSVVICCFVLLSAGALFAYILISMRYSLVKFIYAANPDKPAALIIKESIKCVCGNESYILEVFFSMGLWIASGIMLFPLVYVIPYLKMVTAVLAEELIEYNGDIRNEKKRSASSANKEENTFV